MSMLDMKKGDIENLVSLTSTEVFKKIYERVLIDRMVHLTRQLVHAECPETRGRIKEIQEILSIPEKAKKLIEKEK